MYVFVIDKNRKPLDPCHPARARDLLRKGRASVFRRYPFTIILKDRTAEDSVVHEHRVKIDPGSKTTGMSVVQEETGRVVFAAEIQHRGYQVKVAMDKRRSVRLHRRFRKTRYRQPRFLNRKRSPDWLQPSFESRVSNVITWVGRCMRYCPTSLCSFELVCFDTQKMDNPEISGIEYQQGTLEGFSVREYLLGKWGRKCVYCGKDDVPLQIDHFVPKSRGGSNRVSNLTLACEKCNLKKSNQDPKEFLKSRPDLLSRIESQRKKSYREPSAVDAIKNTLLRRLRNLGLGVETGSGALTKFNRTKMGRSKAHWVDSTCVGLSTPPSLKMNGVSPLLIKSWGHGRRQRCRTDKYGFPKLHFSGGKFEKGFQTGDIGVACIPKGPHRGKHTGRVVIRTGNCSFQIGAVSSPARYIRKVHRCDGYSYSH